MSDRNKEVVPGRRAPVLSQAVLARTHELNRDYVELLLAERRLGADSLPASVLDTLHELRPEAREALAACPFSLFSLSFDDVRFWNAALEQGAEPAIETRFTMLSAAPMQTAFCATAIFLAWHTAQSQRLAARLLFGMPDAVLQVFLRAPLWQIRRVAFDYPGLLAPRWPRNPAFWPDLIRYADAADWRLEAAQLLGHQLMASELEGTLPRAVRQRAGQRVRRQPN